MRGIIFDVDGTLLDSMGFWGELGARYLKTKGIRPEENLGKKLFPMTTEEGVRYLKAHYPLEGETEGIVEEIQEMIVNYYSEEVKLKDGVKEILKKLHEKKIPMTIATSSERDFIEKALERLGVLKYFQKIFTCTEIGKGKDAPDIFLEAARQMDVPAKDTWVAEDGLYAAKTARKAGFHVAGIFDACSKEEEEELRKVSDLYLYTWKEFPEKFLEKEQKKV